ncbi:MAG: Panacea domain-containing protein [Candidatus Dormibacteria bacterium]
MTSSAHDIANQLLFVASRYSEEDDERSELLTHLKLQKLLYYVQGFHLVLEGEPAFREDIVAWAHGPVVKAVYETYKGRGSSGILPPPIPPDLPERTSLLIDQVSDVYGQFSAWRLREMTHETPPWKDAMQGSVISRDSMREYFSTQVD